LRLAGSRCPHAQAGIMAEWVDGARRDGGEARLVGVLSARGVEHT
jgi:hypothetical protein